jgi:hypothetical protein
MTQSTKANIPLIVFNEEDRFTRFGQAFKFVPAEPTGFILQNLANGMHVAFAHDQMAQMFAGRNRTAAALTTGTPGRGHSSHAADEG